VSASGQELRDWVGFVDILGESFVVVSWFCNEALLDERVVH
jgi:hypothetical protein